MTIELDSSNRAQWEADRRHYLGASDAAAVLGLSPWATAFDVWAGKTGRTPPMVPTLATRRGHALERLIADLWEEGMGVAALVEPAGPTLMHPQLPHVAASPDWNAVDHSGFGLIECKDVGQYVARDWAEGAPKHVVVQAHVQLAVTGREWCDIAAMISGRQDLYVQRVHRDPLGDRICEALEVWWQRYIEADTPPALVGRPEYITRGLGVLYPDGAGATVARPEDCAVVLGLGRLKALAKELKDEIAEAENVLRDRIGDSADLVHPETGASIATWHTQERTSGTDWAGVCTELGIRLDDFNEALGRFVTKTTNRTLRTYPKRAQ